jgi:hypothetical protein
MPAVTSITQTVGAPALTFFGKRQQQQKGAAASAKKAFPQTNGTSGGCIWPASGSCRSLLIVSRAPITLFLRSPALILKAFQR